MKKRNYNESSSQKTKILLLIPHRGITNTTLKPPLKHLQLLRRRNKCIYSNSPRPEKVWIFYIIYSHILLSSLFFLFQLVDFTIGGSVASTTPVSHISSLLYFILARPFAVVDDFLSGRSL